MGTTEPSYFPFRSFQCLAQNTTPVRTSSPLEDLELRVVCGATSPSSTLISTLSVQVTVPRQAAAPHLSCGSPLRLRLLFRWLCLPCFIGEGRALQTKSPLSLCSLSAPPFCSLQFVCRSTSLFKEGYSHSSSRRDLPTSDKLLLSRGRLSFLISFFPFLKAPPFTF